MPKKTKKVKSPEQIQKEKEENERIEQENLRKINLYSNATPEYIQDVLNRAPTTLSQSLEDTYHDKNVNAYNLFPNKEAINTAMEKYSRQYAIALTFVNDVNKLPSEGTNGALRRDTAFVSIHLSDGSDEDIVKQASRFLNATKERQKGNFEPMRQIITDIIDKSKARSGYDYDFTKPEEIYEFKKTSYGYSPLSNMFQEDKEFYNEFCKDVNAEKRHGFLLQSFERTRNFEDREIAINVDKIIPSILQFNNKVYDEDNKPFEAGGSENEFLKFNIAKTWDDIILNNRKNPKFVVNPLSIGVKLNKTKDSYDPSNFKSFDKMYEAATSFSGGAAKDVDGFLSSFSIGEEFIRTQGVYIKATEYQNRVGKKYGFGGLEFASKSIFIGEDSLEELTEKHIKILQEKNPDEKYNKDDVSNVLMTQALGDPSKVISTAYIAREDGAFKFKVVPIEKDYSFAAKASEKTHGYIRSFLHAIGWKYPEEKLQDKQTAAITSFKESNTIKSIEEKINTQMRNDLDDLTKTYEVKKDDISVLQNKEPEVEKNTSRVHIVVEEANHSKENINKQEVIQPSHEKQSIKTK